jgi:hypothetical protein
VLGANPGHIIAEVPIHLPRPRDRRSPTFEAMVDQLYAILTGHDEKTVAVRVNTPGPLTHPLPAATVGGLAGLVEIVYAHNGQTDLPDLADELSFEVDDLLPLVDAAVMLGLLAKRQGERVSECPSELGHVVEVHPVDGADQRAGEQGRGPGGDALHFLVLLQARLGQPLGLVVLPLADQRRVHGEDVLQQHPEPVDPLDDTDDVVLHIAQVAVREPGTAVSWWRSARGDARPVFQAGGTRTGRGRSGRA